MADIVNLGLTRGRTLAPGPEADILQVRDLVQTGRYADALGKIAAARLPSPELLSLKAFALLALRRDAEAAQAINDLLTLAPPTAETLYIRARALWRLDRTEAAIADLEAAVKLAPGDAHLRVILGRHRLAVGDFARGWADYEQRTRPAIQRSVRPWNGESLAGKHLAVIAEQGLGDTLQFCRYLPILRAMAGKVTAIVQPAVAPLVASIDPLVAVTRDAKSADAFDLRVDMLSVPFLLRTDATTIPAAVPYLTAAPAKVAQWATTIGPAGPKIGVAWQGSVGRARDDERSLPVDQFAALAYRAGVRIISLQGLNGLENLARGTPIERLGPKIESNPEGISEIAAAMRSLDLIVCSDSMTAHLAGALGVDVWVGLKADANWRWLRERRDSPWYRTMRLFRQPAPGDWRSVMSAIATELRSRFG